MKIIANDSFRSNGLGVNKEDDMVRVTIDMTKREFLEFRAKLPTTSPMLEIALCLRSVFNITREGGMGRYDNLAKKIDAVVAQLSA